MKRRLSYLFLAIALPLFSNAQCDFSTLSESCISSLDTNSHFLKSYPLDKEEAQNMQIEHSYVLTRGTDYFINVCTSNQESDISVDLYDSKRKLVASTKGEEANSSILEFDCRVTGIYYLNFTFEDSGNTCASAVLSFMSE